MKYNSRGVERLLQCAALDNTNGLLTFGSGRWSLIVPCRRMPPKGRRRLKLFPRLGRTSDSEFTLSPASYTRRSMMFFRVRPYAARASLCSIACLGCAPMIRSINLPSLKMSMVGMLAIWYWAAVAGFSSTFNLAMR